MELMTMPFFITKISSYAYFNLIPTILLITSCVTSLEGTITEEPYVVTNFPGVESLYLRLQHTAPRIQLRLTERDKWKVCRKIFLWRMPNVQYSSMMYEILIHPEEIKHKLKNDHLDIFNELFEENAARLPWQKLHRYKNRSQPLNIFVNGNEYVEYVFTCLVESTQLDFSSGRIDTFGIKRYYISNNDYNVNEVPGGEYIAGRFLFSSNEANQIIVHSLAEENSSPSIIHGDAEVHYWRKRNEGYSPTFLAEHDPICKLDDIKKQRMCASVTTRLRRRFSGNVRVNECVKKSFTLHQNVKITTARHYEEWMLECEWCLTSQTTHTFYVSRSYDNNEVFVFTHNVGGATFMLLEYKKKVSFMSDNPKWFRFDDVED